jgi:predicted acetylornithine/succinylornithine family transaminase
MVRGNGVYLYDETGKAYLDFASGIAVNALGYNDAGIAGAIKDALQTGLLHTSNLYRTRPGEELAQFLVDNSFASSVFFCNSGAEANEGAFKFARKFGRSISPEKTGIVSLRGAFHGRLFASLAATDRPAYQAPFLPLTPGVSIVERTIEDLDAALDARTVAAVIVEPVQGEGGVRVIDHGLLAELRALTHERRIALIFDEIQCGFGRTGTLFAYEQTGVVPDMITVAKPMAGGLPMGAVLMSAEIASEIKPGDHGTTFGGGPFVASVALHVVKRLAEPALLQQVRDNGEWFGEELLTVKRRTGRVRAVRGMGLMWGMDVVEPAAGVVARAMDAGMLILSAGEYTLRLLPPLVITRNELREGLARLEEVLK